MSVFVISDVIVFPRVALKHYKLKLCRKTSASMNKDHICQAVSKPTPRPTKLKNFSGHSSVIYSGVQYGTVTWGKANKTLMHELDVKLNNIVRTMTYGSKYCSVIFLYKTLNFLKLDDIYRLELAKFMYQLHHKKFKTTLKDCFVDITKIHSYNTRTKHNLVYFKPRVQTSAGKKSLTYRGTELWRKIKT